MRRAEKLFYSVVNMANKKKTSSSEPIEGAVVAKKKKGNELQEFGRNSATATLMHTRISAQKARLVLGLIRNKQVEPALRVLQYSPKKAARLVEKLLNSAVANAREHEGADIDRLWVTGAWANEGRTMKRFMPRSRGSADEIKKRSSHITVVVGERGK